MFKINPPVLFCCYSYAWAPKVILNGAVPLSVSVTYLHMLLFSDPMVIRAPSKICTYRCLLASRVGYEMSFQFRTVHFPIETIL